MPASRQPTIYLDYNATTPLDPEVRTAMIAALDAAWGNPSSVHRLGRHARALLDESRERLAATLACKPGEVVFTSGGTEANNLAVFGAARLQREKGRHLVCSMVEHHSVLHACERLATTDGYTLSKVEVDGNGRVSVDAVIQALRPDTVLVSVMAANNETGVLQPVSDIGRACRERGILFHTDAAQWIGKVPLERIDSLEADLVSLCAHKLHGPKGAGALYVRSPLTLPALLVGGAHENERRAGTENLLAIVGLVEAAGRFIRTPAFAEAHLLPLRQRLEAALARIEGVVVHALEAPRLCNTVAFSAASTDSMALLAALDLAGVCASSGSACAVGSLEPSHVIRAMGHSRELAGSLVRLSLGRENTEAEIESTCGLLPEILRQVRQA